MAEQDKDQKTEAPTPKRLREARAKGQVASSPEARHVAMFAGMVIVTGWMGVQVFAALSTMLVRLWGNAEDYRLEPESAQNFVTGVALHLAWSLAPLMALLVGCAILSGFLSGRPVIAWSRVKPRWSTISPVKGFSRLFNTRALIEFAKTIAKFVVIVTVAIVIIRPHIMALDQLVGSPVERIGQVAGQMIFAMVKTVAMLVAALGLFDFIYQRRAFIKRLRMTKQEVKDEYKNAEGDPKIKRRIRSIQIQRARSRMMAAVPTASVIITNPTHYSVALKYEHGTMAAPVVVAKGVDELAFRIREVAKAHDVPVIESPPLARALYASADLDRPIPVEHYAAVAEVIGYIMRLARKAS